MAANLPVGSLLAGLTPTTLLALAVGFAGALALLWLLTREAESVEVEARGFRLRWKRRRKPPPPRYTT